MNNGGRLAAVTGATASAIATATGGAGLTLTTFTASGTPVIASFAVAPVALTVAAPLAVAAGVVALAWYIKKEK
jgi:hypothetical protein